MVDFNKWWKFLKEQAGFYELKPISFSPPEKTKENSETVIDAIIATNWKALGAYPASMFQNAVQNQKKLNEITDFRKR